MKTILVVGAGGFIGGFICRRASELGYKVWAGVRPSTSRRYLDIEGIHIVDFDYDSHEAIEKTIRDTAPEGRWDTIIYNLGATKALRFLDFNRINFDYLRNFVEALRNADAIPRRFLYMSSLGAVGPGDEKTYSPIRNDARPKPNTRYGLSKIKAENFLEMNADIPWTIFRPTGVYGPHEQDYLMMIKAIDKHFDFGVGYRRQLLTFIYVDDLVNAMFDALESPKTIHRKYILSEPRAYSQAEFRKIVAKALGHRFVVPVILPLWVAKVASVICEKWGAMTLKTSTLNRDKFKIMKQRNWNCDITDAVADFGFSCRFPLEKGIEETVKAYLASK